MWSAIHFGDDQRHVFLHAQGAGIGDHGASGVGEAGSISRAMPASSAAKMTFGAPSGAAGETFILATAAGMGVFKRHGGFAVGLAGGAVGGRQPCDLEPRMVLQQLDKSLSDDAGGAENPNRNFAIHRVLGIL